MEELLREKASKALKSAREAKLGLKNVPGAEVDDTLNFSIDPEIERWVEEANTATRKALDPKQKASESKK